MEKKNRTVFVWVSLAAALVLGGMWALLWALDRGRGVSTIPLSAEAPGAGTSASGGGPPDSSTLLPGSNPARESTATDRTDEAAVLAERGRELGLVNAAGLPVPGAEAWVFETAKQEDRRSFLILDSVDSWMQQHGTPRLADEAGKLQLPDPSRGTTLVLARHGELWGKRAIDETSGGPLLLELKRDVTLLAQVIDPAGQPVPGVEVELRKLWRNEPFGQRRRTTEDQTATVRFRHAQHTVVAVEGHSWAVGVDALLAERVEEPLDPEALPEEVVILTLPPVGLVEVKILAEDWTPYLETANVTLGIVREGEPHRLSPFSEVQRPTLGESSKSGVVRFPMVEVGRELEIRARRNHDQVATHAYGPGPTRDGDTAHFEVRLGSDHPVALVRVVDEAGALVAEQQLVVQVEMSSRWAPHPMTISVETDATGSFRVDLAADWTEGARRILHVYRGSATSPDAAGELDISRKLRPGTNDLGEVVLGGPPIFAAGRVVSTTGEGIAGADLVLGTGTERSPYWEVSWSFHHQTDGEGRFTIQEHPAGEKFRLGAWKSGWAGFPAEFTPGEENLVIEMRAEGAIAGSVLLDPEIPRELIRVDLTSYSGGVDNLRYENRRTALGEGGSFRLGGLLPGEYAVKIMAEQVQQSLCVFSGLVVQSGETNSDPRLAAIDLRGALWLHHVKLLLPDGFQHPSGELSFGPAGAAELESNGWIHQTEFDLLTTEPAIDLEVTVQGLRPERREGVRGAALIRLDRGQAVRMVLAPGIDLPEPPLFIKAVLVPVEAGSGNPDFGAPVFDETREIVVRAPGTGKMKVTWIVERRGGNSSTASAVNLEREQIVEVLEGAEEQRVEVRLSEEELATILERLQ